MKIILIVWQALAYTLIPLLALVILPHILPSRFTGLSSSQRLHAITVSMGMIAMLYSAQTVLHLMASAEGSGSLLCAVDSALGTFLITGVAAHLPAVTYVFGRSIITPSKPLIQPLSLAHTALFLCLIYSYALIPLIPTLTTAAGQGFNLTKGFGIWWGMYCIDNSPWWRLIRPVTLIPPLAITLVAVAMNSATLYSNLGHPSLSIAPSKRQFALVGYIALVAGGGIAYLILEQVMGWKEDWSPRVCESSIGLLLFLPLALKRGALRPYAFWLRLKRPPPYGDNEITLPISNPKFLDSQIGPPSHTASKTTWPSVTQEQTSRRGRHQVKSSSSSFFPVQQSLVLPTAPPPTIATRYNPRYVQPTESWGAAHSSGGRPRSIPGRTELPYAIPEPHTNPQVQAPTHTRQSGYTDVHPSIPSVLSSQMGNSEPFVYSITNTISTSATTRSTPMVMRSTRGQSMAVSELSKYSDDQSTLYDSARSVLAQRSGSYTPPPRYI